MARSIRRFCLDCIGATSGRDAFDCQCSDCPLYVCMPFRGKPMPKHLDPGGRAAEEAERRAQEAAGLPRRRPSKGLIAAYCRHCQPEDRTDCDAVDCGLFPWRPWQPGGQPKTRKLTESQKWRLLAAGQSSQFQESRR